MDVRSFKRGRQDGGRNGAPKRPREETESFTPGSKSKPCMKFFSTSGCQFGEGCHFLHYVPGGYNAAYQGGRKPPMMPPPPFTDSPAPPVKTKLCNKINTPEGCTFGDKCRFAHSEAEIGSRSYENHRAPPGPMSYGGGYCPTPAGLGGNFGESATAKISIDASLVGAVIGKGGVNSKHICGLTGVKLTISDHDSDQNQKTVELQGSFDQIKHASAMVRDVLLNLGGGGGGGPPVRKGSGGGGRGGNNFKTKMCENFAKGECSFGERCHFAHGAMELRTT
ncbi:hypothetical protein L2E82_14808 [Cichorium intybus]|uniref:Uncharacterized protein n=1 Tax=Cichorium intybus TaxID=13427 RepID=A0ACB9F111_CICIN|nr:hypothetical protein L2E82_14808 [Cichorium intybus]